MKFTSQRWFERWCGPKKEDGPESVAAKTQGFALENSAALPHIYFVFFLPKPNVKAAGGTHAAAAAFSKKYTNFRLFWSGPSPT